MMVCTLPFAPPRVEDADVVRAITGRARAMGSDLAFANIYLLQNKYNTQIAVRDGVLFRYFEGNARLRGYAFPCGVGDDDAAEFALRLVEADARARHRVLRFCLLTDDDAACLRRLRPGGFVFTCDRGNADYVYRQHDLAELPGAAFHAKRNHLSRLARLYPDWHFQVLTREFHADALAVTDAWFRAAGDGAALQHERRAICRALDFADVLQLVGGLVYVGGCPVALSLASLISPEVADVHFEKCHPEFRDAYPAINRCMAELLAPVSLINREEDMNVDGLRKAKLSYHPALLLNKWDALPCGVCDECRDPLPSCS